METDQGLTSFNDFQNQLATTLNPAFIKQNTKELVGNMLLMFGVPFFLGRLEKHISPEAMAKVKELIKDPTNIVNNTKKLATELFQDKVLAPVKDKILSEASKYVPELKNVDLENITLDGLQDVFKTSILGKLKDSLPADIASKLPVNFTRDDILSSMKDLGSEQALSFAKKTLPDEAYQQLLANKDLITDPTKIGDFMRGKLSDVESGFTAKLGEAKQIASTKLKEVSTELSGQFDEHLKPFKSAVDNLKTQRDSALNSWEEQKNLLSSRLDDAVSTIRDYKTANPDFTDDDIQPFKDAVRNIKNEARGARTAFTTQDEEYTNQITQAQSALEAKSNEVLQTLANVKASASNAANDAINTTKANLNKAVDEGTQLVSKTAQQATAATEELGTRVSAATEELGSRVSAATEEGMGFFQKLKSGAANIATNLRQKASSFINPTTSEPSIAEAGHGYSMVEPSELESGFSEGVISKSTIGKSKFLSDYYATSRDDPSTLIRPAEPVSGQVAAPVSAEPITPVRPTLRTSEPQFTDQEAAQKSFVRGTQKPVEVLPKRPAPPPESAGKSKPTQKTSMKDEPSILDEEATTGLGVGDLVGGAVGLAGEGLGVFGLAEAIKSKNKGQIAQQASQLGLGEAQEAIEAIAKRVAPKAPETAPETAPEATQAPAEAQSLAPEAAAAAPEAATATESLAPEVASVAETTGEAVGTTVAKAAASGAIEEGVGIGLDAIPGLDVLGAALNVAGLLGSIFGAGGLMGEKAPPVPIATGSSFEPDL